MRSVPSSAPTMVISSPHPASQSGQVRYAVRVACARSAIVIRSGSHATDAPAMIRRVMEATEPRHTRVLRRVHPAPAGDTTVLGAYDAERPHHDDGRPWLGLCMVSSLDGSTVVQGRSSALSSDND